MKPRLARVSPVFMTLVLLSTLLTQAAVVPERAAAVTENATPPSDTIGPEDPGTTDSESTTTWTGPDRDAETSGPEACNTRAEGGIPPQPGVLPPYCSDFRLTVTADGVVEVSVVDRTLAEDIDLYVYDNQGREVGSSAFVGGIEFTSFCASPEASPYLVRTVYFTTVDQPPPGGVEYDGEATYVPAEEDECTQTAVPNANFVTNALTFGPSTLVSAHFLGSEPQTTVERPLSYTPRNALNPDRVFVDWPLSSRSQMGQLSRSLDGGESFRHILDFRCWDRNRPNCASGGGGDTEEDVNPRTGFVMFSDQEVLANEAFAGSFDHGDSFLNQTPLVSQVTATDRQWIATTDASFGVGDTERPFTPGPLEGFIAYHVPCEGQFIHGIQSTNAAGQDVAQPLPQPVSQIVNVGQSGQPRVDVFPSSPAYRYVYQPYHTCIGNLPPIGSNPAGSLQVGVAYGPDYANPLEWKNHLVDPTTPDIFSWSAVDPAGNLYVVWSVTGVMFLSAAPINDPRNNPRMEVPLPPGTTPNPNSDAGTACNPAANEICGTPGAFFTPKVRVSLPGVTSAVFPEVIAGSNGRIGITYDGTTEPFCNAAPTNQPVNPACPRTFTGLPDNAPPQAEWNVYAAVITNPLSANGQPPTVSTGIVSHRPIHLGNVCTSGTGCIPPFDRSLLDMTDIGLNQAGQLGVVYTDNFSHRFHEQPDAEDESPFTYFAEQLTGPSALAGRTLNATAPAGNCRTDLGGDAYWPNITQANTNQPGAGAVNLPALDAREFCLTVEGNQLVGRITLQNASLSRMAADLAEFNARTLAPTKVGPCATTVFPVATACVADRLQYIVRFNTVGDGATPPTGTPAGATPADTYHLSMEFIPTTPVGATTGTTRFFAGVLDANDKVLNPGNPTSSGVIAAGYHTDPTFPATGQIQGNTIIIRAPLSAFGFDNGTRVTSATAFSTAGPIELATIFPPCNPTQPPANPLTGCPSGQIPPLANDVARTVDATPPQDLVLTQGGGGGGGGGGDDGDGDGDGDCEQEDDDDGDEDCEDEAEERRRAQRPGRRSSAR